MEAPLEFLHKNRFAFFRQGFLLILERCPLCRHERSFQMHALSGYWECNHCQQKGSLYDLKLALGLVIPIEGRTIGSRLKELSDEHITHIKKAHEVLLGNSALLKALSDWRGFSEETIKHFELGYYQKVDESGEVKEYLVIPHKFGGKYYNAKLRSWVGHPKEFVRIPNQPTILFNADVLESRPKCVLITEAELDAIAAWEAGIKNVVALTAGCKGGIPSTFIPLFDPLEKIIIAFDGDDAGRAGAFRLAKQLGLHRCWLVDFGEGYDLNDYFRLFGRNALLKKIEEAVLAQVGDVEAFDSLLERLQFSSSEEAQLETGFPALDAITGGYDPNGYLITLASLAKSGKTTFACALALQFAIRHGPALIFCLEMEKEKIARIIASQISLSGRYTGPAEAFFLRSNFREVPLYHAFMGSANAEVVLETIREAFYRYGVQFVVFDNIHYLVRGVDNKASRLADIVKSFALLARELGIIILLIAQPKKMGRRRGVEIEMSASDIAWTSALESDSDLLLIINRPRIYARKQTFSPIFKVVAEASRFSAGGVAYFVLDSYSASIFEVPQEMAKKFDEMFNKLYNGGG